MYGHGPPSAWCSVAVYPPSRRISARLVEVTVRDVREDLRESRRIACATVGPEAHRPTVTDEHVALGILDVLAGEIMSGDRAPLIDSLKQPPRDD